MEGICHDFPYQDESRNYYIFSLVASHLPEIYLDMGGGCTSLTKDY